MMIPIQHLQNGINEFAEKELTANMDGIKRIAVLTAVGLYAARLPQTLSSAEKSPMISPLKVCENGTVDIDAVYTEMSKHFDRPVVVNTVVGAFEFTKDNLNTLYNMIKRGGGNSGYGI